MTPQAEVGAPLLGQTTNLDTGKGFDHNQITKLKDACGISMAKEIPNIWYVIQSTKGKTFDTYRAHLAKSMDSWCCTQHIERDKSIYLPAKFFEDLITLRFNLGGPVAQYESVARGISMLVCRSLSVVEAEYQQGVRRGDQTDKANKDHQRTVEGK